VAVDRTLGGLNVASEPSPPTNQPRPAAEQLTDALAAWLAGPVTDSGAGGGRFEARIAANLVRVLGREARLGAAAAAADRADLADLLGRDGSAADLGLELAQQVRSGRRPLDDQVLATARRLVARQLLIANPAYLTASSP
jgi:Domain of unknown function (DUF6285)